MFRPFSISTESNTKMLVRDSCTVADAGRLEQLQLETTRIVTGLTAYASLFSLYAETGWEKLNTRCKIRKLSLFYNIVKICREVYINWRGPWY
jgi:hypothetical protein